MKDSPCKYCPKKGCGSYHDICKEYQEYRAEREEENTKHWKSTFVEHDRRREKKER